jgi:hypothetical protein
MRVMTFTIAIVYVQWLSQILQGLNNPTQQSDSVEWCQTLYIRQNKLKNGQYRAISCYNP